MSKAKNWCWTLNNPTEGEKETLRMISLDVIQYMIAGMEVGAEGQTPHLQGYVQLKNRKRMNQVKELLGGRVHLEVARGSPQENKSYCSKDGEIFLEVGELQEKAKGARTDLLELRELIRSGATMMEVRETYFTQWLRYRTSIEMYYQIVNAPKIEVIEGEKRFQFEGEIRSVIFWGEAGIGKTEFAKQLLPKALFVSHMDDLALFEVGVHEGIIFDDMDFTHFPRTSQIHVVDFDNVRSIHIRYAVARIPARTPKIFTTNTPFGKIFDINDAAIRRRIVIKELII